NPPAPDDGRRKTRPFDFQLKIYNQSHPDIIGFIQRVRELCDEYGAVFTVAEVGGDLAETEMKAFTAGEQHLNSAYGFDFLYADRLTPKFVEQAVSKWTDAPGIGWPSWAFENHDAPRALSRWCAPEHRDAFGRLKAMLFASLRGNIIVYQGEELGLTQVDIPFEQLQDPEAIANWPLTLSRDGARTPMPWIVQSGEGGFTVGVPWLPVGEDNLGRAVDRQEADADSLLNLTTALLRMRRDHPALRLGTFEVLHADECLLVIRRIYGQQSIAGVFNLSSSSVALLQGLLRDGNQLASVNGANGEQLPPFGALLIEERI
ncbi:MAG: alpha-glucosidase, partial [Sphingomonadales bacterium 39-62-4]